VPVIVWSPAPDREWAAVTTHSREDLRAIIATEDRVSQRRVTRRMAGLLNARLPELELEQVGDPRRQWRRWRLQQVLQTVLVGLMAGCHGLAELETLTERLSVGARRLLRLPRRLPDTTARDPETWCAG
jgi:hypothetical protein